MEHLHFDLGNVKKGATVVVTLNNQANVQLMTSSEYRNYQKGRRFRYFGGLVKRSPFRVKIQSNGHWNVVVDRGGLPGRVRAAVTVEPPPRGFLPPAVSAPDEPAALVALREVPAGPGGELLGGQVWDVFISHASEDKGSVARPLKIELERRGVTAWLDEAEMQIGQSLRRNIDQGIRSSRYGVVVLSEAFMRKGWTNHELDGLITRNVAGEQSLLPIWHDLSAEQVREFSPSLADKVALSTQQFSIEEIAEQIASVIGGAASDAGRSRG